MAAPIAVGARWAFLSGALTRLAPPVFAVALARVLAPADFGLVAVAMVVVSFVNLFQDLGLKQALVQRREIPDPLIATVFWVGVGLGLLWFGVIYASAPLFGSLYRNPDMVPLLRLLACLFLVTPLGAVPEALLMREMDFRRLFWVELAPALLPGTVAIGLGLLGYGAWALVWGSLAGGVARTALLWTRVAWRPSRPGGPGEWKHLFGFGRWVSLETFLAWLITYVDQAFAGRFLGAAPLGHYRMGFAFAFLPATALSQVLGRLLFPAFSRVQDDRAQVAAGFAKGLGIVGPLTIPMGVAMAAYADPAIPVLLGERWRPTVQVVQLLAVAGVLSSLVNVAPPLYRAMGRVDIMPKFFLLRAAVSTPAYWYGAQQGLFGLTLTHLVLALGFAPLSLAIAFRVFATPMETLLRSVVVPLLLALCAAGLARLVFLAAPADLERVAWVGELALFLGAYVLLLRVLARRQYDELWGVARRVAGARA